MNRAERLQKRLSQSEEEEGSDVIDGQAAANVSKMLVCTMQVDA